MTIIVGGMGRPGPVRPTAQARGGSDFTLQAEMPSPAAPTVAPAALVGLEGVLALQETEADAARDRRAKRHGMALLDALAGLQFALLHDPDGRDAVTRLEVLAGAVPDAADPRLAGILAAIVLRARVELARREPPRR